MKTKGILFLIALVAGTVLHALRKRDARKRLARMATGRVCLSCDSDDVVTVEGGIRCETCGYVTGNSLLAAEVSEEDIDAITRPPDPRENNHFL